MQNLINTLVCSILICDCIAIELYPSGKVLAKAFFCTVNVEKLIEATPKLKKIASLTTEEELAEVVQLVVRSYCIDAAK